jgi:membrane-associated phospholipid phosphatase
MEVAVAESTARRVHRVHWWKEALIAAVFYGIYSWTRNQFGSNQVAADGIPEQPFTNAERVIDLERHLGLFHEQTVQAWFLGQRAFIQFWNVYYGTAHFAITLGVFVLLFVKRADVFPMWRNTLAAMTALAILGFAFFPLMPPRLLDTPCPVPGHGGAPFGGACIESDLRGPDGFGFVDTLSEFGGPWSFDSETMASISNQYASMPSLHIGWATWCAIAVWPLVRRRWLKATILLYPLVTLFCIVVTANHYWIDGVGGLVVFAVGALFGWGLHRWNQDRLDRKFELALAASSFAEQRSVDGVDRGFAADRPVRSAETVPRAGKGNDTQVSQSDPD